MKRLPRAVPALCFCVSSLIAGAARADLAADVRAALDDPLLANGTAGVVITRLGDSERESPVLFEQNPATPLIPASNLKVVTTSAALEHFGSDFNFRTLLLAHDGDLVVVGDGDPTLGDDELYRRFGWKVDTVFKNWADALVKAKLTRVKDVRVDDSVFDQQFFHPHWPADQFLNWYSAEIGGLNLNANCLGFYVQANAPGAAVSYSLVPPTDYAPVRNLCVGGDSSSIWLSRDMTSNDLALRGKAHGSNDVPVLVTVHDPPLFAGTFLAETLKRNGVTVTGGVVRDRTARAAYAAGTDKGWTPIAVHETPLTAVIARANKDSMNLYAECVCKRLGFAVKGEGTWANGTAAVAEFLRSIGVDEAEFHLDDGCGLSKENRVSARLMTRVLTHNYFGPNSKAFVASLAVAGELGTLSERFRGTDLKGRVLAKSGFVNGVGALSGFLHTKDDHWYAFSILFNGVPKGSNSGAKAIEEKIVRAIDAAARARKG